MEEITDADYIHGKRVCKDFEIKSLGEYHDLYLKSNTLLLTDVFENFRKICLKTVGKGIRGGICHAIHQYAQANDKYMKIYDKNKESLYLKY